MSFALFLRFFLCLGAVEHSGVQEHKQQQILAALDGLVHYFLTVSFLSVFHVFRRLLLGYPGVYFLWLGLSRPAGESRLLVIFLSPFFITRHILPFRVRRRVLHQPPAVATLIMSSVTCWELCCGRPLLNGRRASGPGRQI